MQSIQKSDDGINLANELLSLENGSSNIKYFGALTFTVQLTKMKTHEELWCILQDNLFHITRLIMCYVKDPVTNNFLLMTIKKMMSNLSLIFTNVNQLNDPDSPNWNNPINTLVHLISISTSNRINFNDKAVVSEVIQDLLNQELPYCELIEFIQSSTTINTLILLFTKIIVEDLKKFQSKRNSMSQVYNLVHNHLYISTMSVLNFNLESNINKSNMNEVFDCISAWISYISMARNVSANGNADLTEIFKHLIRLMCISEESNSKYPYSQTVINILGDIFGNDPTLMNYELRCEVESIFLGIYLSDRSNLSVKGHEWMQSYLNYLVINEFYDELKELSQCVVDFLQINNLDVCNKLFTSIASSYPPVDLLHQYIKILLQLTNFPLVPVLQESYSVKMVDFWLDLCESFCNLSQDSLRTDSISLAESIFGQVVEIYLPKIGLMNKQRILGEDSSLVDEFEDFRIAVQDLIEVIWSVLGHSKLTNGLLLGMCQSNNLNTDIFQAESMVFLLSKLLNGVKFDQCSTISKTIKDSNTISKVLYLLQTGIQQQDTDVNSQILKLDLVKTSTNLIVNLSEYFQIDSISLDAVIKTILQCLDICRSNTSIKIANKMEVSLTIALTKVCDTCKYQLTEYLPTFIQALKSMFEESLPVSFFTKEKLVRSVGYVIQSSIKEGIDIQAHNLLTVIDLVKLALNKCTDRSYMLSLLTCISELGSGMLSNEDDESYLDLYPHIRQQAIEYWKNDPLCLRIKIMNLVNNCLIMHMKDSEFIEVSCLIMGKALLLSEEEYHFLRFTLQEILEFALRLVDNCDLSTGLPYIVYLLEKLIGSYKLHLTTNDFDLIFTNFFLNHYKNGISLDPDLIQVMISFVNETLDIKPTLVIHSIHWKPFILPEFLKFLLSKERFTIRAVTKFWCKVVNNKKYTQNESNDIQEQINSIGPRLVLEMMIGLLNAQRSDVSYYSELLRLLVAKYPLLMKTWLTKFLPCLNDNCNAHEKFISKLLVTRGSKAGCGIVQEWWLECNNLPQIS